MNEAVKDFKLIKADKTLSPFEKGTALLALRAKYGASAAGGFISDTLVGLDNLGTSFGNFFRPSDAPKALMEAKEGRDWFTGRNQSQVAARDKVANSTVQSEADILKISAAKGKAEAVKELSKLYPNLDNTTLNKMLDELLTKPLNLNTQSTPNFR